VRKVTKRQGLSGECAVLAANVVGRSYLRSISRMTSCSSLGRSAKHELLGIRASAAANAL